MKTTKKGVMGSAFAMMQTATTGIRSLIEYSMSSIFSTDTGEHYLYNSGSSREANNAQLNSGRHLVLDATQELPIEVPHTLGSDIATGVVLGSTNCVVTGAYNTVWALATLLSVSAIRFTKSISNSEIALLTFNANINSGSITFGKYYNGTAYVDLPNGNYTVVNGVNNIEIGAITGQIDVYLSPEGGALVAGTDIDFTSISVKQITTPANTAITYWDATAKEYVIQSSDGSVGDYYAKDREFVDTSIVYPTIKASYTVSGGKLLGVGTALVPANQVIRVVEVGDITDLVNGQRIALIDNVTRATGDTVGFNTDGLQFDTGNAYYYYPASETVGEHLTYATVTDKDNVAVGLHISTTMGAETDWEYFALIKAPLEISTTRTFTNQSVGEIAPLNNLFTQADIALMNADNQLLGQLALGSTTTGLSLVTADLYGYYPVSEVRDRYAVDTTGHGVVNAPVTSWATSVMEVGNSITGANGVYNITQTVIEDSPLEPNIIGFIDVAYTNIPLLISIDIIVNSGNTRFAGFFKADSDNINDYLTLNEDLSAGSYSFSTIGYRRGAGSIAVLFNGSLNATVDMDVAVTMTEATASEITNYAETVRTNGDLSPYGMQLVGFKQDALGIVTAIADAGTTEWTADGRTGVTNWTITPPYTVTEVIDGNTYTFTSDGNRYLNAVADGTFTLPTGEWTLNNTAFDGVTPVTARGNTKLIPQVIIP